MKFYKNAYTKVFLKILIYKYRHIDIYKTKLNRVFTNLPLNLILKINIFIILFYSNMHKNNILSYINTLNIITLFIQNKKKINNSRVNNRRKKRLKVLYFKQKKYKYKRNKRKLYRYKLKNKTLYSRPVYLKCVQKYYRTLEKLNIIKVKLGRRYERKQVIIQNWRYKKGGDIDKHKRKALYRDRRLKKLFFVKNKLLQNFKKKKTKLYTGKIIHFKKILNNKNFMHINYYREMGGFWKFSKNFSKNNMWWLYISSYLEFLKEKNNNISLPHYFWFVTYLQLYFYKFLGYKVQWYLYNFLKTLKESNFVVWWNYFYRKKILKNFFEENKHGKFLYVLINLIFFKNIDYLVNIIQRVIWNAPLRSHKKYFYNVKSILYTLFNMLQIDKLLKGYTVFFKGKLARKGSVRKSVFFYKYGKVSKTNKFLRVSYRQFLVYTETGVVGCYISLFY